MDGSYHWASNSGDITDILHTDNYGLRNAQLQNDLVLCLEQDRKIGSTYFTNALGLDIISIVLNVLAN